MNAIISVNNFEKAQDVIFILSCADKMIQNGALPNTSHSILMIEQVRQEFSAKQAEIFAK